MYQKWNNRTCSLSWNPEVQSIVSRTYLEAKGGRVEIRAELRTAAPFYVLAANERTKKHSSYTV